MRCITQPAPPATQNVHGLDEPVKNQGWLGRRLNWFEPAEMGHTPR